MSINGVGANSRKTFISEENQKLQDEMKAKYVETGDDTVIDVSDKGLTKAPETFISEENQKLLDEFNSKYAESNNDDKNSSNKTAFSKAPETFISEENQKLLDEMKAKYPETNKNPEPTPVIDNNVDNPANPSNVPENNNANSPTVPPVNPENGETQNPTVPPVLENEVVSSFDGDMSNLECVNRYKNRLSKNNADYNTIFNDLMKDASVSVYDKCKLLKDMEAKGYAFDKIQGYTTLLSDMATQDISYSIDDINKINEECINAYLGAGISKEDIVAGNCCGNNSQMNSAFYQMEVQKYLSALTSVYASKKYEYADLEKMFSTSDLAVSIQHAFSGEKEAQKMTRLISAMPQGALNLNEIEPYKTSHVGHELDYKSIKQVLKDLADENITVDIAAYVLSSMYESPDKLIADFRGMMWFNQEAYLEKLMEVMQFAPEQSE